MSSNRVIPIRPPPLPLASCAFICASPTLLVFSLGVRLPLQARPVSLSRPCLQPRAQGLAPTGYHVPINKRWCYSHTELGFQVRGRLSIPALHDGQGPPCSGTTVEKQEAKEVILAGGPAIWIGGYFRPQSGTSKPGKMGDEKVLTRKGLLEQRKQIN